MTGRKKQGVSDGAPPAPSPVERAELLSTIAALLDQRHAAPDAASFVDQDLERLCVELEQQQEDRLDVERALRESEERYRIVAETASDAIVTVDERNVIVFANPATERIFGYSASELLGRELSMLIPESAEQFELQMPEVPRRRIELRGRHKDDHEVPLEIAFGEFRRDDTCLVTAVMRDITERRRADELSAGETRVLHMLAAGAPLAQVLDELARLIEVHSHGMLCSILLLDESGGRLRHGAAPSLPAEYVAAIDGCEIGERAGSCGTAAYRGEPVVATDIATDPLWTDYRSQAAAHGLRACWSTPIRSQQGKVLGAFAMYFREARPPNANEKKLIDIAIQIAGIAIERELDLSERRRAEERIRHMAQHDSLTSLPNRALLRDRVGQAISQAHRNRQHVALLFVDLDRFKDINDTLGHRIGDRLLRAVARRLLRCVREGDSVARLGGDEFVICLAALSDGRDAMLVSDKVLETLRKGFLVDRHALHVTGSIGISLYPENGEDTDTLMRAADTAMYHAKERGRDNFQFFVEHLNQAAQRRMTVASRLRLGLSRGEFELHYQPQTSLASGRVFSAEALIRWPAADVSMIPPVEFIKIAEETGLIVPLGEWVLRRACEQLRRWRSAGLSDLRVTVNLSPHQLRAPGFADLVRRVLDELELPPAALELEITEGLLMMYSQENVAALGRLARMGVRLAIDDFGTGYSSLSYLQRFPISVLKIDRSFVSGIGLDPNDTAIVSAIIAMAESLKLEVIAEGVETPEQVEFLKTRSCYAAQGFYYSKALPAQKFYDYLGTGVTNATTGA